VKVDNLMKKKIRNQKINIPIGLALLWISFEPYFSSFEISFFKRNPGAGYMMMVTYFTIFSPCSLY
jgi:hypothetical protein